MATSLDNRAELRLAFYRLTGTSSSDGALSKHETASNDTVHYYLWQGMREAQEWYINVANPSRWKKRSSAITSWSTDSVTGDRYTSLASDFLRLFGDVENSALMDNNGRPWGKLVRPENAASGVNTYWIENDELRISKYATIPTTVYYDYYYEAPELTDDVTAPDFPERDRNLIVAFAGEMFADSPAFPGDTDLYVKIQANLKKAQQRIYIRSRRSREPRKVRSKRAIGSHWFGRGS